MNFALIGTLLGDGSLETHGAGARLRIHHSEAARAYVEWKHHQLSAYGPSPIGESSSYNKRYDKTYRSLRFATRACSALAVLRKAFYPQGDKVVPSFIGKSLVSPLCLAVWVMDDGTKSDQCWFRAERAAHFAASRDVHQALDDY